MIKCKECGESISSKEKICPKCGEYPSKKTSFLTWIVLIIILFFVYGSWLQSNMTSEEKAEIERARLAEEEVKAEENTGDSSVKNAEFYSMYKCLKGIKKSSGKDLDIITDEVDEISGFLSNGKGFACQRKSTGTKGVYYYGWYFDG